LAEREGTFCPDIPPVYQPVRITVELLTTE